MSETQATDDLAPFYKHLDYDVTDSPHTDLTEVPDRATIQFAGESEPRTSAVGALGLGEFTDDENDAIMDEMLGSGIGVTFLIRRAMLDPDATVIPNDAA